MKRLLVFVAAAGLLLLPTTLFAQTQTGVTEPSPVSQTLVREGDFAVDLAYVMELGEPATEAEAEDALSSVGIAPSNGWIADYPITPDILAELEEAVLTASDEGKVSLDRDEALKAFRALALDYGLPVRPAVDEKYAGEGEGVEYGDYTSVRVGDAGDYYEPTVIREYYYAYDPPVITYYRPPWDYFYLYDWVPYPFWWYGYYYPGYFILNDFSVTVHHHHHHRRHDWHRDDRVTATTAVVTNHVEDQKTGIVTSLDPVSRKVRSAERREHRSVDRQRTRGSFSDVKAAESIVTRELTRKERRAERRAVRTESRANRDLDRATRSVDSFRNRVDNRAIRDERRAERNAARMEKRAARDVDRPTRLGDRSQSRVENRAARSVDRFRDRIENRAAGPERRAVRNERSVERNAARGIGHAARGGGSVTKSAPSSAGRSFSAPSRGGGNRSFDRPRGGGGFNRGGGPRGCRGGNC